MAAKIEKITSSTWYIPDRINTGVICGSGACLLVDTGLDKSSANKICSALEAENLRPTALLVTHTHADHCGGNAALHQKTGIPTYCPPAEAAILSYPAMEPMYLYGAMPPEALCTKFFVAPATPDARPIAPGAHEIGGITITAVPLPGHSPDHYGYLTADGVLFSGDALFPEYVWEKYRLPYFYDIDGALASLQVLEGLAPRLTACVAAHYGPVDLPCMIQANRNGLFGLVNWAAGVLRAAPGSREDIIAAAFNGFGLQQNEAQYYLVGSTIAALLTHLCKTGLAETQITEGRLKYYPK